MVATSEAAPKDNEVQPRPTVFGSGDGVGVKFPSANAGVPKKDKEEEDIIDLKGAGGVAAGRAGGMVR